MKKTATFAGGAALLAAAGLVSKLFGFAYRIYLTNQIGAEGVGIFQLISPIYSLIILTLTSGISVAAARMIAREKAKDQQGRALRITFIAALSSFIPGVLVSIVMFFNLNFISNVMLNDKRTLYSLAVLLPCIPVIAISSAIKGYFYGLSEMLPGAITQIVEQIVKISFLAFFVTYFKGFAGMKLEYVCAIATLGMAVGEIVNLLILFIVFLVRKNKLIRRGRIRSIRTIRRNICNNSLGNIGKIEGIRKKQRPLTAVFAGQTRGLFTELVKSAWPVSANRFITSIMSAVELILIPRQLVAGGLDPQLSMQEFGRLSGMALPLILFPSLITSSLSTSLVPGISECASVNNYRGLNQRISKAIQITAVLGFAFTAIFMTLSKEVGDLFYRKENIGDIIYLLSFSCIFIYLQQTLTGILNGLGRQRVLLQNSLIGYVLRILAVYFLVPVWGLKVYIIALILCLILVSLLNLTALVKATGITLLLRKWFIKPALIGGIVYLAGNFIKIAMRIVNVESDRIEALISISLLIIVAVLSAIIFNVPSREDLKKAAVWR
ncbi:MAG: polysaccharide biosynthesis protein [Clostridiales bacterium]|nr:polysaccharide biosynthesis protein [Clostridiales bacterium]